MARIAFSEVEKDEISVPVDSAESLFGLGLLYSAGADVEQDLVSAHKWFNLAALKGNEAARDYRAEIASEMSTEEIAEAQRRAREWLQTH